MSSSDEERDWSDTVVKDWSDPADVVAAVKEDCRVLRLAPARFWQNHEVVKDAVQQPGHRRCHPFQWLMLANMRRLSMDRRLSVRCLRPL